MLPQAALNRISKSSSTSKDSPNGKKTITAPQVVCPDMSNNIPAAAASFVALDAATIPTTAGDNTPAAASLEPKVRRNILCSFNGLHPSTSDPFECLLNGVQVIRAAAPIDLLLLKEVLFEPRGTVPRGRIDLSAWAHHLSNPAVLCRIADENPLFTSVAVRGPSADANDDLIHLLGQEWSARGIRLLEVDLSACQLVTDHGVLRLVEAFPCLQTIKLNSCPLLTDRALTYISKRCPDLRCLEVSHCPQCTTMGLASIVSKCNRVVALNVAHCPSVTDRFLLLIRYGSLTL